MADKTKRRANSAREKISKMVREIEGYTGKKPTVVTVTHADFLALTEVGWIRDGKLSGTMLEVKPG